MKEKIILENMQQLQLELYKIQTKNWILNQSNGTGAAGRTLEILLGKPFDHLALPDYNGIEIKTQMINIHYDLRLFSMALDNKPLEMQRLLNLCGYPDRIHPEFKVFRMKVNARYQKKFGNQACQLFVDYSSKLVRLLIYKNGFLIETDMSWSFAQLKSRLEHKLQYLALIPCKKWTKNEQIYFKYFDATFYKLKGFDIFLKLIDEGIISVVFKLGYYKSGVHFGQIYDHGTTFEIESSNLECLFQKIAL